MLLSKANYNWGLNQASHREEAKTTQVLKIQSSDIARGNISQISRDLKEKDLKEKDFFLSYVYVFKAYEVCLKNDFGIKC